jgi:serine/threonine-protein kinase
MARARPTGGGVDDELEPLRAQAERAIRLAPTFADAHAALGAVLFQANDAEGAVHALLRALRLAPNHADSHDLLGRLLLEAGDPAGVRHVEAAMALEPNMGLPRSALSRFFMLQGDSDRSDAILEGMTNRSSIPGIRSRYVLWMNDRAGAKALLAEIPVNAGGMGSNIRLLLDVVANGTRLTTQLWNTLGRSAPRWVAFVAQIRAECACAIGDPEDAISALASSDAAGLFDVAWADRCPVIAPLRERAVFRELRDRIAARAARASAAYALSR